MIAAPSLFTGTDQFVRTSMGRRDLARLFAEMGFRVGAEIGVWEGAYSIELCQANPALHLICVDPWVSYDTWVDRKNRPKHDMNRIYERARNVLQPYHCDIRRGFSADVVQTIPDGSLDFVYIDGNHNYHAIAEDLRVWVPKVRSGGIVSGHDYRRYEKQPEIEVERAVNEYVAAHGIRPLVAFVGDKSPSFAWMVP